MRVTLEIGDVSVRAGAERHTVERVTPAVKEAFRLLAERLHRAPAGSLGDVQERVLGALDTEVVPLDELLSPRGAERLADEWYRQLVEVQP